MYCSAGHPSIRKPYTLNLRVLHSFIYGLKQSVGWGHGKGAGQNSCGYETYKVHFLPQQQSRWSGLPHIHLHRTTVENKIFASVIIIKVEQYSVTLISTVSIDWPWEKLKRLDLLWLLFLLPYSQNRSTKLSCNPLCCHHLSDSEYSQS